jgi:hypothetical protein
MDVLEKALRMVQLMNSFGGKQDVYCESSLTFLVELDGASSSRGGICVGRKMTF